MKCRVQSKLELVLADDVLDELNVLQDRGREILHRP